MESAKIPLHVEVERARVRRLEQYQYPNLVKTNYTTYQEFYVPVLSVMLRYNMDKKARQETSKLARDHDLKSKRKESQEVKDAHPRRRNAMLIEEVLKLQQQRIELMQPSNQIDPEDSLSSYRSAISSVESQKPSARSPTGSKKKQFHIEQRIHQLKELERKQKIRERKKAVEAKLNQVEMSKKSASLKAGNISPSNVSRALTQKSLASDEDVNPTMKNSTGAANSVPPIPLESQFKPPKDSVTEQSLDSKNSKASNKQPHSQVVLLKSKRAQTNASIKPSLEVSPVDTPRSDGLQDVQGHSSPTESIFSREVPSINHPDALKQSPAFELVNSNQGLLIDAPATRLEDLSFGKQDASLNQLSFGESRPNLISQTQLEVPIRQESKPKEPTTKVAKTPISQFTIQPIEVEAAGRKMSKSLQAADDKDADGLSQEDSFDQDAIGNVKSKPTNRITPKQSLNYQSATDVGVNKNFGENSVSQSREKLNKTFNSGSWMFQRDSQLPERQSTRPLVDYELSKDSMDATIERWADAAQESPAWRIPSQRPPMRREKDQEPLASLSYASAVLDEEYLSHRGGKASVESEDHQNYPTALYELPYQEDNSFEIVKPEPKPAPKVISIRDMAESTSLRPAPLSSAPEFDLSAEGKSTKGSKYDNDEGLMLQSAQDSLYGVNENLELKPVALEDILSSKYNNKPKRTAANKKKLTMVKQQPPQDKTTLKPLLNDAETATPKSPSKDESSPSKAPKGNKRLQVMGGRVLKPYGTEGQKIKEKLKEINEPFSEAIEGNMYYQKEVMLRMMEEKQRKINSILAASKQSRQEEVMDDMLLNPPTKANMALLMAREAEEL